MLYFKWKLITLSYQDKYILNMKGIKKKYQQGFIWWEFLFDNTRNIF